MMAWCVRFVGRASRRIVVAAAVALAAGGCGIVAAQTAAAPQSVSTPQEQTAAAPGPAPASVGLSDLNAMTFGCPKAGLNAAAREAAGVPSQGTYQFAYFRIINDAHHASYEVHFKSNYIGEADLKYCVTMYCQQGWDPATAKVAVALMGVEGQRAGAAPHAAACAAAPAPVKGRSKR